MLIDTGRPPFLDKIGHGNMTDARPTQKTKSATTVPPVTKIHMFGDSHMHHLLPKPGTMARRMGFNSKRLVILGEAIGSASVAGFRPRATTLQTKDIIRASLPEADRMVLGFGQVDLELGYYYRRIVKGDKNLTPENYVPWLLNIYLEFISSIGMSADRLLIKGCHLTMFSNATFTKRYVGRIIKEKETYTAEESAKVSSLLQSEILGEDRTNAMMLDFNEQLKAKAAQGLFRYFDINDELGGTGSNKKARLKTVYMPAASDHHLVDSIALRRTYLRAVLRAFDLSPKDYFAAGSRSTPNKSRATRARRKAAKVS